ncbi:MAG: glucosaminidase domain-containing protein, partial [Rikenellaceae bacterium]
MTRFFILTIAFIITASTLQAQSKSKEAEHYIKKYYSLAISSMKEYGIPASITLAQGLLESGNGQSVLAKKSNNHFGIKCKKEWTGAKVYHDDDEAGECFRKYPSVEDSYIDHAVFLTSSSRYSNLFTLPRYDYKAWAHGLKKAGYATNPKYPSLLINLIELYELDNYDRGRAMVPKTKPSKRPSI